MIVLAALRHDQRLADLAGGIGVSRTPVDRWLKEMIDLLAAQAPRLERVLARIARSGGSVVLIDGALLATQRRAGLAMTRRWSAKHKRHGLLISKLTDLNGGCRGRPRPGLPGARRSLPAATITSPSGLSEAGLTAIADVGFVGLDDDPHDPMVITGYEKPKGRSFRPQRSWSTS